MFPLRAVFSWVAPWRRVILKYPEGSTSFDAPARSFGVPQDDEAQQRQQTENFSDLVFFRVALLALLVLGLQGLSHAAMKPGDVLPPLDSFKLEGKLPAKLKGQVILLDFWASWCGPCKSSFPAMEDLHKRYAAQGLTIVAVSVDDKRSDMERFLKTAHVSFATVRDARQKLVATANVATMPTSFLIDRSGKIRFVHNGFRGDESVKKYREEIEALLKESAP